MFASLHQPDQDRFKVIRSEEIPWRPFSAFPDGASEYITQVSAIGPLGLEYVDRAQDPRSRK